MYGTYLAEVSKTSLLDPSALRAFLSMKKLNVITTVMVSLLRSRCLCGLANL